MLMNVGTAPTNQVFLWENLTIWAKTRMLSLPKEYCGLKASRSASGVVFYSVKLQFLLQLRIRPYGGWLYSTVCFCNFSSLTFELLINFFLTF